MIRFFEIFPFLPKKKLLIRFISNCRQTDRFYDGDIFIDAGEDRDGIGIENTAAQNHPLRSRDNIYEFKDSKQSKSLQDTSSVRSPSSLGVTTTKTGSQSSLRSAGISLKESPTTLKESISFDKSHKYSDRSVETNPKGKYDDSRNLLSTYDKSREALTASPTENKSTTPVPTARKNLKNSRTHLVEGIPQTEV